MLAALAGSRQELLPCDVMSSLRPHLMAVLMPDVDARVRASGMYEPCMLVPAGCPLASEFDIISDIGGDKDELPTSSVG